MSKRRRLSLGSRCGVRQLTAALLLLISNLALGTTGTELIHLTPFPSISVADGKSIVNIDAEVRDTNGKTVPDGTRVLFGTDLGSFRNPIATTQNGIAHATLVAGSIAGIAKITANALGVQGNATLEYQFVSDRSLLSSAKEYVEIVGYKEVRYHYEDKVFSASGPKRGAFLRYREVELHADDLQFNVDTNELKAKNALLKIGKVSAVYGLLYFKLQDRHGYGMATIQKEGTAIQPFGRTFRLVPSGKKEDVYTVVEATSTGPKQFDAFVSPDTFAFEDFSDPGTEISSKKVTAFPHKRILFEGADVSLGRSRLMKVPLYQLDLTGQQRLFSDQILNVNNNQLSLNYPYYLNLKPGVTSLLRLRTGQSDGSGLAASRGVFLDYEYNWNRGDDMQGGVTVGGLGRSDWGIHGSQYWRAGDGSTVSGLLEVPAHRSIFGSLNAMKPLKGAEMSFSASAGRAFRGDPFDNSQYNFVIEKDPVKLGKLPIQAYFGAQAYSIQSSSVGLIYNPDDPTAMPLSQRITDSQSAYGLRMRLQSQQITLGRSTGLTASLSLSKLQGHNTLNGLTTLGSASLSHSFGSAFNASLSYDYTEDGYNSSLLGRHQLSLQTTYNRGNAFFSLFAIRALDIDRFAYQMDTSYRLNRTWRFGYSLFNQGYLGDRFLDSYFVLGYRLGYKEFGLTWSQRTHRFGFQLLGTTFN